MTLDAVLGEARACRLCEAALPGPPRPIVQAGETAGIVVIGQAPGRRVHESGVPWDDPSGDRLRSWLGIPREVFYDPARMALVPMGFCYPGRGRSGDNPPRPECAPTWHDRILAHLRTDVLRVLVGRYAHDRYLGAGKGRSLTATVRAYAEYLPDAVALPHPSPRNQPWLAKNPWFEVDVLPVVRSRVQLALHG